MTNPERKAFEDYIQLPPIEANILRWPDDCNSAWPGNYRSYPVDLAWDAWQARAALASPPPAQAEPSADVRVPDGWKLVPIEPTPAMVEVGRKKYMTKEDSRRWWAETLAAVPLPKEPA